MSRQAFHWPGPLTKHLGSSWRAGHPGLGLGKAPQSRGLRCLLSEARAAAALSEAPLLSAVGAGPSRGEPASEGAEGAGGGGPGAGARGVNEGSPPNFKCPTAKCTRGGSGTSGGCGGPGCKSPSCGCYWQPSLCLARSPAAPGRKVARGSGCGAAAAPARRPAGLSPPPAPPRSLRALTAAARHEGPEASSVGGVAASQASNYWRPLRTQHGSPGSKTGFVQPAAEAGAAEPAERPPAPAAAESQSRSRRRPRAGPSKGLPRARTRLAFPPRPFVLLSAGTSRLGGF